MSAYTMNAFWGAPRPCARCRYVSPWGMLHRNPARRYPLCPQCFDQEQAIFDARKAFAGSSWLARMWHRMHQASPGGKWDAKAHTARGLRMRIWLAFVAVTSGRLTIDGRRQPRGVRKRRGAK